MTIKSLQENIQKFHEFFHCFGNLNSKKNLRKLIDFLQKNQPEKRLALLALIFSWLFPDRFLSFFGSKIRKIWFSSVKFNYFG